jgi:hypothetical protein
MSERREAGVAVAALAGRRRKSILESPRGRVRDRYTDFSMPPSTK